MSTLPGLGSGGTPFDSCATLGFFQRRRIGSDSSDEDCFFNPVSAGLPRGLRHSSFSGKVYIPSGVEKNDVEQFLALFDWESSESLSGTGFVGRSERLHEASSLGVGSQGAGSYD